MSRTSASSRILRFLVGDDIFVSYSRFDGATYAAGLASLLTEAGYSCYLDQWGTEAGKQMPRSLRSALRRSTTLVLIGSPGAALSPHVADEVRTMRGLKRPVIPIVFDGVRLIGDRVVASGRLIRLSESSLPPDTFEAVWASDIDGQAIFCESAALLVSGHPSEGAVSRIARTWVYRTRSQRLRLSIAVLSLFVVVMASAGIAAGIYAAAKSQEALSALAVASAAREDAARAISLREQREREQRITFARELAAASIRASASNLVQSSLLAINSALVTLTHDKLVTRQAVDALAQSLRKPFPFKVVRHPERVWNGLNVGFSPDGRYLVLSSNSASGSPSEFFAWDIDRSARINLRGWSGYADSLRFSSDGRKLLITGTRGTALLSFPEGRQLWKGAMTGAGALHPEGRLVAISERNRIELWDTKADRQLATFGGFGTRIEYLQFALGGRLLVATTDRAVKIWDVPSQRLVRFFLPRLENVGIGEAWLDRALMAPSGRFIALTAANNFGMQLWNASSQALSQRVQDNIFGGRSLAFSPDGHFALHGGSRSEAAQTVSVWALEPLQLVSALEAGTVEGLAVSEDGRRVITSTDEQTAVWSLQPLLEWDRVSDAISLLRQLPFSADGTAKPPPDIDSVLALFRELANGDLRDDECTTYHLDAEQCRASASLPAPRPARPLDAIKKEGMDFLAKARASTTPADRVRLAEDALALDPLGLEAAEIWVSAASALARVNGPTDVMPLDVVVAHVDTIRGTSGISVNLAGRVLDHGQPVAAATVEGIDTDAGGDFVTSKSYSPQLVLTAFKEVDGRIYYGEILVDVPPPPPLPEPTVDDLQPIPQPPSKPSPPNR